MTKYCPRSILGVAWLAFLCITPATPAAAQSGEPLLDRLRETFQTDYLTVGALLQTVADFQMDRSFGGNNGFSVANFRVSLRGELDMGFGYFLQTSFTSGPAILDARMSYRLSERVRISAGQFKAPFSAEFLTPASAIDFVNRSQVVTALVPGRQIGMQLSADVGDEGVRMMAGAFNGNSASANGNDNNDLLYVGRVSVVRPLAMDGGASRIEAGANVAYSHDQSASFGGGFVTGFSGNRTLLGVDARVTLENRYLLAGELIGSWLDPDLGATRKPWGVHLTGGYMVSPIAQVLVRWDGLEPDDPTGRRDWLVLGGNLWPTGATEVQANYIVDLRDAALDRHQLLLNFQIGF